MLNISRLPALSLEQARTLQFRLVDAMTHELTGTQWLTRGDLGVGRDGRGSVYTQKVEAVLACTFGTEDAVLVTGAGTGAIRSVLFAMLPPTSHIVIHDAPLYSTTAVTFRAAGYQAVRVNFHDAVQMRQALEREEIRAVYIQHTRQQLTDHYVLADVIQIVRAQQPKLLIVVDDNYAVANTPRSGVELGADISAFSAFKLLGPEGIGVILCSHEVAEKVRADMYSGGTRVQGFQAYDVLIGMSQAFVANAITQETAEAVVRSLRSSRWPEVAEAYVANMQSPVVLIRFHKLTGEDVANRATASYGAASYPIGAMSRYELVPMFYRVSGSMKESLGEEAARHWIRINPLRAGHETVLSILEKALKDI